VPTNLYDDPEFFARYSELRRSVEGLSGAPEWRALQAMLPPLGAARVLDLGCGFGRFCRYAREAGASRVLGVDISENMLARARAETDDPAIEYVLGSIDAQDFAPASFDVAFSSLALHYLPDVAPPFDMVHRALAPGGRFVFSVEHPIYTAPSHPGWVTDESDDQVWPLNRYLDESARITDWLAPGVVKYHRTVATYVNTLIEQGFRILHLEDWGPTTEQIAAWPEIGVERERPFFLLLSAEQP
jgi:SAM-dependent methyltransferase